MQHSDEIPELEELLTKNRSLTAKEASLNKELEHLCFDMVLVNAARKTVEEERSEVAKAIERANRAYAIALQVESRLNNINLTKLLGNKLQLNKMETDKDHKQKVEMLKKRQEGLNNMEKREIVQQFRHLQSAIKEAEEELVDTEKKYKDLLHLKREKIQGHNFRFNNMLVGVLMAQKQILESEEPLAFESTSSLLSSAFESVTMNSPPKSQVQENISELIKPNTKPSILKKSKTQFEDELNGRRRSLRLIMAQISDEDTSSSLIDSGKRVKFATPLEHVRMIPNRGDEKWRENYFYKSNRNQSPTLLHRILFSSEEEKRQAVKQYCEMQVEKLYQDEDKKFRLSVPKLNYPPTTNGREEPAEEEVENGMDGIESEDENSERSTLIRPREDDADTGSGQPAKRFAYDMPSLEDEDKDSSSEHSSEDSSDESFNEEKEGTKNSQLIPMKSYKNNTYKKDSSQSSLEDSFPSPDNSDSNASIVIPKKPKDNNTEEDEEDLFQSGSPKEDIKKIEKEEEMSKNKIEKEEKTESTTDMEISETLESENQDDDPGQTESLPDIPESCVEIEETPEELTPMEVCEVVIAESKDEMNKIEKWDNEKQKEIKSLLEKAPVKAVVTNVEIIVPPRTNAMKWSSTAGKSPYDQPGDDIPSTSTGRTHAMKNAFDDDDIDDFFKPAPTPSRNSLLNFASSNLSFDDDLCFNDDDYDDYNSQYNGINYDL
nr:interaptin-like [Drosophila bipectinata]